MSAGGREADERDKGGKRQKFKGVDNNEIPEIMASRLVASARPFRRARGLRLVGGQRRIPGEKTLIYGRGADSKSLDPIQVTDGESLKVTENIFDTLVDYDDDNTEVVPGLAERWESSKDGKTWTFYLRKGVKFHDGTDFNAEAVVYNFERWMDKDHPEQKGGEFPYYGYMFGGYKGDKGHVIKSVNAVDEHTVKFELNYPQAPFLNNLAMPPFGIASPTAVKKDPEGFGQKPVGTGPFKLESWKKNDTITLVKNEDYWQEGLPKLDKLIYRRSRTMPPVSAPSRRGTSTSWTGSIPAM